MATDKTKLTELGTAVGLVWEPTDPWPDALERLELPGVADEVWRPVVLPVVAAGGAARDLLLRALANGRLFRRVVLRGRRPERVEWTGGTRAVWTSDIPRDLTVDGVYFLQAKYDSTCVLNTAPATLVDDLLFDTGTAGHPSWYEEVAPRELQAYWRRVRADRVLDALPTDVRDLDAAHRSVLKVAMRAQRPTPAENLAYAELCRAVSEETVRRWRRHLRSASGPQQTQMLFRMLRVAGGPYWLLGTKGATAVQLAVTDTRTWRERFALRRFTVRDAHAGQPQVNWRAEITDRAEGHPFVVEGYCEIRWSHGKLQGHPECKVQVTTPLDQLPGYEPMS
ncbi:MAG: hypothetical protein MUF83_09960 [Acidimicrobiales bacterium]|jgi:hypothetical protein|nr:hypothetical protein [Acidimicrobiales bacterium]